MPSLTPPKVSHNPSHQPSPWRVYFRGKSYWFREEADANQKKLDLESGRLKARFTARQLDEYQQCLELLQGISVLRAVRYYVEHNSAQFRNATRTVKELGEEFVNQVRGRKKYTQEARRNIRLLCEHCGTQLIVDVSVDTMKRYFDSFASEWSHDNALKFAKAFFKWCVSPLVRARVDNPCDVFKMKNPHGSKIYLSLADAAHVLKICREEFPRLLPAIGLQMFAGIRTEEIIRIGWSSIRRGKIRIEPEVGKMGQVKGKQVPRIIDFWPTSLDACMPAELPTAGKVARWFDKMKTRLLERCRETKPDFRWGQNAFRHAYGTYGLAFFQSAGRMCQLMGERDADTLYNHYAEYEEQTKAQEYFSLGAKGIEPLPIPKAALNILSGVMRDLAVRVGSAVA